MIMEGESEKRDEKKVGQKPMVMGNSIYFKMAAFGL